MACHVLWNTALCTPPHPAHIQTSTKEGLSLLILHASFVFHSSSAGSGQPGPPSTHSFHPCPLNSLCRCPPLWLCRDRSSWGTLLPASRSKHASSLNTPLTVPPTGQSSSSRVARAHSVHSFWFRVGLCQEHWAHAVPTHCPGQSRYTPLMVSLPKPYLKHGTSVLGSSRSPHRSSVHCPPLLIPVTPPGFLGLAPPCSTHSQVTVTLSIRSDGHAVRVWCSLSIHPNPFSLPSSEETAPSRVQSLAGPLRPPQPSSARFSSTLFSLFLLPANPQPTDTPKSAPPGKRGQLPSRSFPSPRTKTATRSLHGHLCH